MNKNPILIALVTLIFTNTIAFSNDRLPSNPLVVDFEKNDLQIGQAGGTLETLMPRIKDIRLMVVYGYARLVGFNKQFDLESDILEKIDIIDQKSFTLHLRKNHRWSDGTPFTSEDFRYYWEDVALNKELMPSGPPVVLYVNGQLPKVTIIDETTIRYEWEQPNPNFLSSLAKPYPLFIYRPSQYLKNFHAKYADKQKLDEKIQELGQRNWAALHNKLDNMHRFDNPELPTLQPWMNTTALPSDRFIFKRNPYFHRVDPKGQQLPYIDEIVITITDKKLVPAKAGVGESDLQARGLKLKDFTFLKQNSNSHDYNVFLWDSGKGSKIALYPNLNFNDLEWQKIIRDVRFRKALSLGIDRSEINQVVYSGIGFESQNTVLPQSPLYKIEYAENFTAFDIDQANLLLDEMGLKRQGDNAIRTLPSGKPVEIIIETAGEDTEQVDVLQLIEDSWQKIGVKLFIKPSQRDILTNRIYSGETMMTVWSGLDNGLATPSLSPADLAPVKQNLFQWPKWGQYHETKGQAGVEIDMPEAKSLLDLFIEWQNAKFNHEKEIVWHKMLGLHSENLFTIGIISGTKIPILAHKNLRNLPSKGVYSWFPGSQFGIYHMDTFWWEK